MKRFTHLRDDSPVVSPDPATLGTYRLAGGSAVVATISKSILRDQLAAHEIGKTAEEVQADWFATAELLAALDLVQHRQGLGSSSSASPAWELDSMAKVKYYYIEKIEKLGHGYLHYDETVVDDELQTDPALALAYWITGTRSATWSHLSNTNYPSAAEGRYANEYQLIDEVRVRPGWIPVGQTARMRVRLDAVQLPGVIPPVEPLLVGPGTVPALELHFYDYLDNRGQSTPTDPLIYDQDESLKQGGFCAVMQIGHADDARHSMREGKHYIPMQEWLARKVGLNGVPPAEGGLDHEVALRLRQRLEAADLVAGSDAVKHGKYSDPSDSIPLVSGIQTALELRDKSTTLRLPHYYIDQTVQAPILLEHLESLKQQPIVDLATWRLSFFEALGCMLGQEAIVGWIDDLAQRRLDVTMGLAGVEMPLASEGVITDSDDVVTPHTAIVLEVGQYLEQARTASLIDTRPLGPANQWLSCIYDPQTLTWNTPICIQEMRLYLLWALQSKLDAIRLYRLLQSNKDTNGMSLLNLEAQFKMLLGGCCVARAPLHSWLLPALYVFLLKALPDIEDLWANPDELVGPGGGLRSVLKTYLQEKWKSTVGQDQKSDHFDYIFERLAMDDPVPYQQEGCYNYMLLALLGRQHVSDVHHYATDHEDSPDGRPNIYKDVLMAVESVVGVCMRGWAMQGLTADDLFPSTTTAVVPTRMGTGQGDLWAVDAMGQWVRSGFLDGVATALAFDRGNQWRSVYDDWPTVRIKRTRLGKQEFRGYLSRSPRLANLLSNNALNLPLAMRHNFPALAAGLGLNQTYWLAPLQRHQFRSPFITPGGETDIFDSTDWDTDGMHMCATNRPSLKFRHDYLARQLSIHQSKERALLGWQWLNGPGGNRKWTASEDDLQLQVRCLYPTNCHAMKFTWSVRNGTQQINQIHQTVRDMGSLPLKTMGALQPESSITDPLLWGRSVVRINLLDFVQTPNQPHTFSTYGSIEPSKNEERGGASMVEFVLELNVSIEGVSNLGNPTAPHPTTLSATVYGVCWSKDSSTETRQNATSELLTFEVVGD